MSGRRQFAVVVVASIAFALVGCGGGNSSNSNPPPPPPPLAITTGSILTAALQGHPYSTTLTAINGQGALHWSMSKVSSTSLFPDGLTIDANTGVISGTANFGGTAGFIAQVTDSASPPHSASQNFTVTAYMRLTAGADQTMTIAEFQNPWTSITVQGGVAPLNFRVTSGSLPLGVHLNTAYGQVTGAPYATGTYQCTVTIQDSYSPPEVVSKSLTVTVTRPPLVVANSTPARLLLNRPFSWAVVANGGTPPYSFALSSGSLPAGLNPIDPSSGQISGTPTTAGNFSFGVTVTDSSSPVQTAWGWFYGTVAAPVGRNDSPATATALTNFSSSASVSPYIDPPETSMAGDNDYYSVKVAGGITLHAETYAKRYNSNNPLDTVLEIVDGNGVRLTNCRQPGDSSTNFTSPCINDDMSLSPQHVQDSALDYQIPSTPNGPQAVYLHVWDWRGDARPDMTYNLQISGAYAPLTLSTTSPPSGIVGNQYYGSINGSGGNGTLTGTMLSGQLPPGITMQTSTTQSSFWASLSGAPTTAGSYSFTLQVSDQAVPPQVVSQTYTLVVNSKLQLATFTVPDLKVGQTYTQQAQASGGVQPYHWWVWSNTTLPVAVDYSTGMVTITPNAAGTYSFVLQVQDSGSLSQSASQTVSVTVNP